jgi:4a-hydroxytetrahydrobiopterin dehydratase
MDIPTAWESRGDTIERTYRTGDFDRGVALVVGIGRLADAAGHHPDILLTYPAVKVTLTTHDAGNRVTDRDLRLAEQIDRLWEESFASDRRV